MGILDGQKFYLTQVGEHRVVSTHCSHPGGRNGLEILRYLRKINKAVSALTVGMIPDNV